MTIALCLNCGSTKFGAFCPCTQCGHGSTGDFQLDIAFSDHHLSEETLEALGGMIKRINAATDDPPVRFWTFIAYISRNYTEILTANPPQPLAAKVDALLSALNLPKIELKRGHERPPPDGGDPGYEVEVPGGLLAAFRAKHPFEFTTRVDVLLKDGTIQRKCHLILLNQQTGRLVGRGAAAFKAEDVAALRTPGSLRSLFRPGPWVRSDAAT